IGVPSELSEDEVMVFVTVDQSSSFDPCELLAFLTPRMPEFMLPRYVEVIDEMPKTPTNKIKKHILREQGVSSETWDRSLAPPATQGARP
ncbi:MAG TPA: hypothetical protein VNG12_22500, partial [Acidimicrobiales bacterium]|nr:hypothetical protein [Acidimicrobiales bacterium]